MDAKDCILKIKSILSGRFAEEVAVEEPVVEETKEETVEENKEEVVVEEPKEPAVEDRIADLEGKYDEIKKAIDEIYGMIQEVVDRQRKPEDEIKEEVREEIREEIVEQMSKVTPTGQPVHVQHNAVQTHTLADRLVELKRNMNK